MRIIGTKIANEVFKSLKDRIKTLKESNVTPHLVVILIGNDPASISYVNQKEIKGKKIGAKISVKHLSSDISESKLLTTIEQLNNDNNIHGIIIQRPLPTNIEANKVSVAVDPKKDVDGFHPNSKFQPPIAKAVLRILKEVFSSLARSHLARLEGETLTIWLKSKKIVVIGKGETGGQPIIEMFKQMGIEPTVIDSKTPNPQNLTKKADIIISAVGKSDVVKPEMLKKGVILIGVGLHRGDDGKLHGDYDEEKIKNIASFYAPTPGGVGPLNVAMLLKNLVYAAEDIPKL